MLYREYQPDARLRNIVECCWELETSGGAVQRVVPDGRAELIVNLGRPFEALVDGMWRVQPRSFLAGQLMGPLLLRPSGPAKIRGIRFRPHGAAAVFGPRMHELAGRFVPVTDPALSLLRAARREDLQIGEAARMLEGSRDVADVAKDLGLSCRQLERRFLQQVGLPPKFFSRIQRFQKIFRAIESASPDWADAAAACGYHDQSHLIRDFRDFTGTTPAALLAGDDLAVAFLQYKRARAR